MTADGPRLPGLSAPTAQLDDLPPQALRLATALSTAVRIEPELLRIVRLQVGPTLTVAAESDLWYGPWAVRNGGAYMALRPALLAPLRERLVAELSLGGTDDPLREIGCLVAEAHQGLSPVLALEERVTWAAVLADAGLGHLVEHTVDELMEPALRAAVEDSSRHEGLRRWFTGAWQRLPERARASRSTIGLSRILEVGLEAEPGRGEGGNLPLPRDRRAPTTDDFVLAVRHDGSHITIGDPSWPATAVKVPDGPVLVLDISEDATRWEGAERITLRKGVTLSVPVRQVPVYLRTETGVVYALGAPHDSGGRGYGQAGLDAMASLLFRERVSQLSDDHAFQYGVHPVLAVAPRGEHPTAELSALPPYVSREADDELVGALNAALMRKNGRFVVLNGEHRSGRTRTLWEAMRRGLAPRWVLRPPDVISATDLAAALREDPLASPAVLWLDDLDIRLAGESGEELARSVIDFLGDPATGDVLLLATTGRAPTGLGELARDLLARAITVQLPAVFGESELAALERQQPLADPRLSEAVGRHPRGRIAQYLSDTPALRPDPTKPFRGPALPHGPLPKALPASMPLIGRHAEMERLLDAIGPAPHRQQQPVVALTGMPGIGKTTLAAAAARQAQDRGLFPGGIVFVSLHGYTPADLSACMDLLLRGLGVPSADIPVDDEGRAALYRYRLASLVRAGRPALLVLDDVDGRSQLQPLLPRVPGVSTLLVSRSRDSAADATHHIELGLLSPDDAVALLQAAVGHEGAALRGSHHAETLRLAELCGFLPLALRLTAARLARTPGMDIADAVGELTSFRLESGLDMPELSVRAALDSSYRLLAEPEARALRYLAVAPGADISTQAAAWLLGMPETDTRRLLAALTNTHLLASVAPQRWSMHNLVRRYAAELASRGPQSDQPQVIARLAAAYLSRTRGATAVLRHENQHSSDRQRALEWLTDERLNLLAVIDKGPEDTAVELALELADFLTEERFFGDLLRINQRVLDAASSRSDDSLLATALNNQGAALVYQGRLEEAVDFFERAYTAYRAQEDAEAEARTLNNLGAALLESGRAEDAATVLGAAVEAYTVLGSSPEQADALDNFGTALLKSGRGAAALGVFENALAHPLATEAPRRTARLLNNLAAALRSVGRQPDAIRALESAVDLYGRAGARHGQAQALNNLGNSLREANRTEEAIACLTEAVSIFAELDDRHGQAQALNNLGAVFLVVGRIQEALDTLQRSSQLHGELGDLSSQAQALNNLGLGLFEVGRFEEALTHLLTARGVYQGRGDRSSEAQALNNAGNVLRRLGRHAEAADQLLMAIDLARQAGDERCERSARHNLGLVRLEGGEPTAAAAVFRLAAVEYGAADDDRGRGQALNNLGNALMAAGEYHEAVEALSSAAELLERAGDRVAWAQALGNLGLAQERVGDRHEAVRSLRASADALAALGDTDGRFHALYNLGSALRRADRLAESKEVLREAAQLGPKPGAVP